MNLPGCFKTYNYHGNFIVVKVVICSDFLVLLHNYSYIHTFYQVLYLHFFFLFPNFS